MTLKRVLLLAYNEGERGKMHMHFPSVAVVTPGSDFLNVGQEYDVVMYTQRVRDNAYDFYLEMASMAAPGADITMVTV